MVVFMNIRDHQNRLNLRKDRIFRDRLHPLDAYDDTEILRRYRLSRHLILELYDDIAQEIEPQTLRSHAIPGMLQLFCALRFYATGTFQTVIGDSIGIHRSSVSRIVTCVTTAICRLQNNHIKFPVVDADIGRNKQKFYEIAQFPRVIGVKSHIKVYRLYNEFNSTQVLPYHRLFRNFIYNYHIRCIAGESVHINGLTYTHKQAIRLAAWHRYTTFLLFLEWNIALFTQDGTLHQYSTFHMHDLTF